MHSKRSQIVDTGEYGNVYKTYTHLRAEQCIHRVYTPEG